MHPLGHRPPSPMAALTRRGAAGQTSAGFGVLRLNSHLSPTSTLSCGTGLPGAERCSCARAKFEPSGPTQTFGDSALLAAAASMGIGTDKSLPVSAPLETRRLALSVSLPNSSLVSADGAESRVHGLGLTEGWVSRLRGAAISLGGKGPAPHLVGPPTDIATNGPPLPPDSPSIVAPWRSAASVGVPSALRSETTTPSRSPLERLAPGIPCGAIGSALPTKPSPVSLPSSIGGPSAT
mmetsp:Transcript_56755/g.122173  ORF Transcript_56755/g.122173 Transcript_56755/m.122173 type:complete len:237 (+) Transcript_56755:2237-2947(+)